MKLVFATNNLHKLEEVQQLLGSTMALQSLDQLGCFDDIPETGHTLEANASQKSHFIFEKYKADCFADDTGLEIEALNNEPGVYSARYAGEERDANLNMDKVLLKLKDVSNRKARFRTVISLLINGKETLFEGVVEGNITTDRKGVKGFGYDPIFIPNGYETSFAEMDIIEKNKISHRAMATNKLIAFLKNLK